jgi:TolB-like protein
VANFHLFKELKRRNVLRAAVLYASAVWALSQGVSQLSSPLGLPDWVTVRFLIACMIGFPLWVAFAWFYEFTPSGVKRESAIDPADSIAHDTGRKLNYWIFGVMALAIVLLLTNTFVWHKGAGLNAGSDTAIAIPAKSIAVLPFENLSADKTNAYFVAGMQDLILTKLADIGDLKVIARTSTMQYGSHPDHLTTIGQQLGVATVLEGSVQKAGNQVLISVQLIDTKTDSHVWAQAYTRTLINVFGVEGEVAEKVAAALKAKLSPAENAQLAAVPTTNQAAYDAFLRAEYFLNKGGTNYDTDALKAAVPLYRQAVEQDPRFALAWARLSITESRLAWFGGGGLNVDQFTKQARAYAEHALALAPDEPASQIALGFSDYYGRLDYVGALKAFAAARALRPNGADALAATGYVLRRQNRFDAAIAFLQQAFTFDPRNSMFAFELGATSMMANRYPAAEAWFQRALAVDPDNLNAQVAYADAILFTSGDVSRALAAAAGDAPALKLHRVTLLTYQRQYNQALKLLDGVPDTPGNFQPGRGVSKALLQANLYRWLGDGTRARPLFEQALVAVRPQLEEQQSIELAQVWQKIADAELGLGETAQALDAIAKAQTIITETGNKGYSPVHMEASAALYAGAGRPDLAVPLLAKALATPGVGLTYSPVLLWLDPAWDAIRHDPSFQALLKKYARYKPAVIPAASAARTAPVASVAGGTS